VADLTFAEQTAIYRRTYDTPLSALLTRIWGGHLHMGLFAGADERLLAAQLRANHRMGKAAGLRPGHKVIETACGIGGTARYLVQAFGVRVTATNIAEAQLAEGADLVAAAGLSEAIDFAFADYHDLPFADARFDAWWCQEALLYAVDKRRVIEEAMRVVKPAGMLVFSDLLLAESVTGAERERFTTILKAPGMWSMERWDDLLADLPVRLVERHDWAAHTLPTFERVYAALEEVRGEFTQRIGAAAVDGTIERISLQLDAARTGKLGWGCYVLGR
jgi:cyclopropane fatty-acyl-phospholipid synthase-like methyltransferase